MTGAIHAFPDARSLLATPIRRPGYAYAASRVSFIEMDVCRLPFDAEFDVAGAFDVIESRRRRCGADGDACGSQTRRRRVHHGSAASRGSGRRGRLQPSSAAYARGVAGKDREGRPSDRAHDVLTSLLLPMMLLSRRKPGRFDPERELKVPAVVNAVFLAMLSVERFAIALGLSLPAGGSLLAVAERPFDSAQGWPA